MIFLSKSTSLPVYLQYPRFLLKRTINETAKLIYILLLDRARLSQANGWEDEQGRIFVYYTIDDLAKDAGKSARTVSTALSDLQDAGLLLRLHPAPGGASRLYPKVPSEESCVHPQQKPAGNGSRKLQRSKNQEKTKKRNYDFFRKGEYL